MDLVFIHGPAASGKLTIAFVRLTCPGDELERRMASASRAKFGKLRSPALFRQLQTAGAFDDPELPDSGLTIDTSRTSPTDAAAQIRDFFALGLFASFNSSGESFRAVFACGASPSCV